MFLTNPFPLAYNADFHLFPLHIFILILITLTKKTIHKQILIEDLRINWRMETNRLSKKHETEKGNLDTKHDRDVLDLETKYQKAKNELHTRLL